MTLLHTLRRKTHTLLRQSVFVWLWLLPVWLLLGVGKALIHLVSFQKLAVLLGQPCGVNPWVPLISAAQQHRAMQIGRVVRIAAQYTPWDANCFPQALVARTLLAWHRIPYTLFFGLRRETRSAELKAHAWVTSGPVNVTGGASFGHYTVVNVFMTQLIDKQSICPDHP